MHSFAFMTATEILFGRGKAAEAAGRAAAIGRAVFLLHGANAVRADWLASALYAQGCKVTRFAVPQEPDLALISAAITAAKCAQVVVALGGGSVIDTGKAVAALLPATRPLMDHLEVVGKGLPLDHAPLPFIAIPTTAGTGAEVTRNAVICVPDHHRKVSLRDPRMLPRLAIIDSALTDTAPKAITLASGMDAITQIIEPYVSSRANPLTDALCADAIPKGLTALRRLMEVEDANARDTMSWVSLCGGIALANAGLGVIHGLAGPLGGLKPAPHGAICGTLLPQGLAMNHARVADNTRTSQVLLWIAQAFNTQDPLHTLAAWSRTHGLPTLAQMGLTQQDCALAAASALASSSMQANPARLDLADLNTILTAS
jgi:alcohol dehydrogenase class IV